MQCNQNNVNRFRQRRKTWLEWKKMRRKILSGSGKHDVSYSVSFRSEMKWRKPKMWQFHRCTKKCQLRQKDKQINISQLFVTFIFITFFYCGIDVALKSPEPLWYLLLAWRWRKNQLCHWDVVQCEHTKQYCQRYVVMETSCEPTMISKANNNNSCFVPERLHHSVCRCDAFFRLCFLFCWQFQHTLAAWPLPSSRLMTSQEKCHIVWSSLWIDTLRAEWISSIRFFLPYEMKEIYEAECCLLHDSA